MSQTVQPFLGKWQLQADQSDYDLGEPPASGLYRIVETDDGLRFYIEWTDTEGKEHALFFDAIPDGERHPHKGDGADETRLTLVAPNQLDSEAFVAGKRVAYAMRLLSDDGQTMRVTQSGWLPDGTQFDNLSIYHRLNE